MNWHDTVRYCSHIYVNTGNLDPDEYMYSTYVNVGQACKSALYKCTTVQQEQEQTSNSITLTILADTLGNVETILL